MDSRIINRITQKIIYYPSECYTVKMIMMNYWAVLKRNAHKNPTMPNDYSTIFQPHGGYYMNTMINPYAKLVTIEI